jgi:SAM-dependent methyltransferase
MLSDLRVIEAPLDKHACTGCGLVRRVSRPGAAIFDSGYSLYDHAPGAPRESARQHAYAEWLSSHVTAPPRSILDLGCGNGSLLLALRQRWPGAELRGIDPSPESVARARDAGIDARCGRVGTTAIEPADLVVSVNVVEHVDDPVAFLRAMAACTRPGGSMLLACPDGGRAWLELLFADHLWSFAASHLARIAAAAGLHLGARSEGPPTLGPFQLVRLGRESTCAMALDPVDAAVLIGAKQRYLQAWATLERDLLQRSGSATALACFGTGEAAALLRAYAPAVWRRVKVCVVDDAEQQAFGDVPVIDYRGGALEWPVLLAVKPDAQRPVAERLAKAGCSVIRWDDCIAA